MKTIGQFSKFGAGVALKSLLLGRCTPKGRAIKITLATLLAVIATALNGPAAVLYGNLGESSDGAYPSTDIMWQAQHFTTDGQDYYLDSVTLLMQRSSGSGAALLEIWSGNNSAPGSMVLTLTSPGSYSSSLAETVFTYSGETTLAANSDYWVVLKANVENTTFDWSSTSSATGSGAGFSLRWTGTSDSGVTWYPVDTGTPYQMLVDVTPVPEASTGYALIGLGLLAFGHARRKIFAGVRHVSTGLIEAFRR